MAAPAAEANVKVFCRFRPLNTREVKLGADRTDGFLALTDTTIKLQPAEFNMKKDVTFDRVFGSDSTQPQVYAAVAKAMVADVMAGFNGTIFAYGQTGAGKSWSMMGPENLVQNMGVEGFDDSQQGIIPRAATEIFDIINQRIAADPERTAEYSVQVSYLEIYRETIRDLLDPASREKRLEVREHAVTGVYVEGLSHEPVVDTEEVLEVLKCGDEARATASTKMNAASSRSHAVFTMKVKQQSQEATTEGLLNLVDLAGSEKVGKTGAAGQTLEEAKKINLSLSALGNVIKALADPSLTAKVARGEAVIPFRDSKLTRMLQSSLGGNTKTSLLLACSPHPDNGDETATTLRFGVRAKQIKTKVKANTQRSAAELQRIVDGLTAELAKLKAYVKVLEAALTDAGQPLPSRPKRLGQLALGAAAADGDGDGLEAGLLRVKLGEQTAQCELLEA
eukprot:SAG22_NODE_3278_length_1810_cov_1.941555_1_plen_450_part_10